MHGYLPVLSLCACICAVTLAVSKVGKKLGTLEAAIEELRAREPTIVQQVVEEEPKAAKASSEEMDPELLAEVTRIKMMMPTVALTPALTITLLVEVTKIKIMMDAKMAQYEDRFYDDTEVLCSPPRASIECQP